MDYISTRGADGPIGFEDALLNGLARDGGLYLPTSWPQITIDEMRAMRDMPYHEVAGLIMSRFTDGDIDQAEMTAMASQTYASFTHKDVAPVSALDDNLFLLELYSGPTIAFKDYAMQFLSRAFDRALKNRNKKAVILGATSGDTGSAALEAFRGRESVDVFILFPEGRVSPVQQKQMTSVIDEGAFAVAVKGDFDDCQALVKASFNDTDFRDKVGLSAVNSINWARLMPQIVYYFTSAVACGAPDRQVAFSVPTGNFGNVFAGWVAMQMGLPVCHFMVASNRNDILTRFFATGAMTRAGVTPSYSPSMDIQVSSNFERLLFELSGRDGQAVADMMQAFQTSGRYDVPQSWLDAARQQFSGFCLDDDGTLAQIKACYQQFEKIIDPHSAVGLAGAYELRKSQMVSAEIPIISLACAHPAKFPDAVEQAIGIRPALPEHLSDLMERPEQMQVAANQLADIQQMVMRNRRA